MVTIITTIRIITTTIMIITTITKRRMSFYVARTKTLTLPAYTQIHSVQTDGRADRQTCGQTDGRADRQTDVRTDRRTCGQTDRLVTNAAVISSLVVSARAILTVSGSLKHE